MLDLTSKAMLAASIRHGVFGQRDSIDEALDYASKIIDNLQTYDKAVVYTALHVVMNTIADKIMDLPDSSAAELEPPPAEVRIDHADLPATGASDLEAKLITLIDSRLANWGAALPQREAHLNDLVEQAIEKWSENAPFDTIIEEWFDDNVDIEHEVKEVINNMSISINVE